uniref:Uncharacterized protein n=1 Tax=termite gut metagenome TaxID=433724 RepID=S0DE88_9ZZZZ
MNNYKKWMKATLALMLALLLLGVGLVVAVDPFFHYHARLPGLSYPFNLENYQNPGIVQHFEYDSLLTGSSVTMEFKPSLFGELMGENMVKVPHSDASLLTLKHTLGLALEHNKDLKTVYYGLDHWALARNPERLSTPLPEYLYDQNPFNDTEYILNKDILFGNTLGVFENTITQGGYDDFDTAYTQDYGFICRESIAVARYLETEVPQSEAVAASFDLELMLDNTRANLENNLLPLITQNPDTTFVVFFTPGSILYWYDIVTYKNLDAAFTQLEMALDALLPQPNVELYFFMDVEDIVCNLYYYFDWIHYDPAIHEYMTRSFAEGRHRLTEGNRADTLGHMREIVEGYDFDTLFGTTSVPMKGAAGLAEYSATLADERYITFLAVQGDALPVASPELDTALVQMGLAGPEAGAQAYAAIAGQGVSLPAQRSGGAGGIALSAEVEGLACELESGPTASVVIDGVEYAQQLPGVNLVVWDNTYGRVVDSAAFAPEDWTARRRTNPRP